MVEIDFQCCKKFWVLESFHDSIPCSAYATFTVSLSSCRPSTTLWSFFSFLKEDLLPNFHSMPHEFRGLRVSKQNSNLVTRVPSAHKSSENLGRSGISLYRLNILDLVKACQVFLSR